MRTLIGLFPDHEITRMNTQLVEPFNQERVQPASYDLSLHSKALAPSNAKPTKIDLRIDELSAEMKPVDIGDGFELPPGNCLLVSTVEVVKCPKDVVARVEGKSSLGRLFLAVHVTAGWVDAGWIGQITLEVVNHGPWTIKLWQGMRIAQVNFTRMEKPCSVPYGAPQLGSHYQNQRGPTAALGTLGYEKLSKGDR